MASKVKVEVKIDDKGSLKETAKNARTADRNLKGASHQSSNATKNFSKMAQGMTGTLVPAYAVLAANVFAVTAAFRFLKEAGDFKVLQESQLNYAAVTGVAMQSLIKDMRTAAEGMLDFRNASEAAAIGIASGLNPEQMTNLAAGAASVSKILGRDLTDSFQRLVRGVTKAEPELLDELGITLRLAVAKEKYAAILGKEADQLDLNQQKQAVYLEVQTQLEEKYNKINKILNPQANALEQLATAFDDVMKVVKEFVGVIAIPTASFLTKNIGSLIVALGLLAIPILKTIIPGLDKWAEKSEIAAGRAKIAYQEAGQAMEKLALKRQSLNASEVTRARGAVGGLDARKGSGLARLQAGEDLRPRQIQGMRRAVQKGQGAYKDMGEDIRKQLDADLAYMQTKTRTFAQQVSNTWKTMGQRIAITREKIAAGWQMMHAKMRQMTAGFVKGINKLMRLAGIIGMLLLLKDIIMTLAEKFGFIDNSISESAQETVDLTEKLDGLNKEYARFAKAQTILHKDVLNPMISSFASFGNLIDALDIEKLKETMRVASGGTVEGGDAGVLRSIADWAADLNPRWFPMAQNAGKFWQEALPTDAEKALEAAKKRFGQIGEALISMKFNATDSGQRFLALNRVLANGGELSEELNKEYLELTAKFSRLGAVAKTVTNLQESTNQKYNEAIAGLKMYKTAQTDTIIELTELIAKTRELNKARGVDESVGLAKTAYQLKIMKDLRELELGFIIEGVQNQTKDVLLGIKATKIQKARIQHYSKVRDIDKQRRKILDEIQLAGETKEPIDKRTRDHYQAQLTLLWAQKEALDAQVDSALRLQKSFRQGFESAFQTNLAAVIKGEEKSIGDAMLKIAKGALNSVADELSKIWTEKLTFKLFGDPDADRITAAHTAGGENAAGFLKRAFGEQSIARDMLTSLNTGTTTMTNALDAAFDRGAALFAKFGPKDTDSIPILHGDSMEGSIGRVIGKAQAGGGPGVGIGEGSGITPGDDKIVTQLNTNKNVFQHDAFKLSDKAQAATDKLGQDIIGGIGGFLGKIGGLFDTKGSVAGKVTSGDFFANAIMSFFGGNSGGYASKKGFVSFAGGGVVPGRGNRDTVPAMLTPGEVVTNPARGQFMGQNNNVVVNVRVDSNGNATTQTQKQEGDKMDQMGKLVSGAVTEELLRQKRPGGLLSPYGGAP